jgi:AraC-like DNA-binding protein
MTFSKTRDIPKEKFKMAKQYPIYVADTEGVNSFYQKLHWHDVLEINLIKSGTGYYIINGQRFEFQQDDILLINSNDLHCAYETKDLVILVITFDASWFLGNLRYDPEILSPFKEMGTFFTNLLDRNQPMMDELRSILFALQDEHVMERQSYSSMVYSHLLRFLASVNRHFRMEGLVRPKEKVNTVQLEKVRTVIYAMEERYAHAWTLEELSGLVFLSPSRFNDIFRLVVGMAPLAYLIHIRLEHSVKLLETTNMKVTEVAHECGFHTLSNFNRLFKKHLGVSPRVFKSWNVK